jgi:5-methyltetrahydropteroyltriglutamate--homocysteine methyltransferase
MQRSTDRILTTHVGSLARSKKFRTLALRKENKEDYDAALFANEARTAVSEVVHRQIECGLDIVNDGEQGKSGFAGYVSDRLSGFVTPEFDDDFHGPWQDSRDEKAFPEYYAHLRATMPAFSHFSNSIECVAPIAYIGAAALQFDVDNMKAALKDVRPADSFMTALSISNVEGRRKNRYYATEDEFLEAIADAMREEYQGIVDAGFVLQIDDPRLSTYYVNAPELSLADCRRWAEKRVDVLNHALRGIPPERIRYHTCYSLDVGPRTGDMNLKDIIDIMLKVNAGAYSFEAANPRHEHEYHVWEDIKLPEGKILLPGVISHTTVLVEHPELIAERIERFAKIVGRENVIASADCGFASTAEEPDIHPSIVWAKLESLVKGAELASQRLW